MILEKKGRSFRIRRTGVYLVESGGLLKIGMTGDFYKRVSSLATSCPGGLVVRGFFETLSPREAEHMLHVKWADHRANGEWFDVLGLGLSSVVAACEFELVSGGIDFRFIKGEEMSFKMPSQGFLPDLTREEILSGVDNLISHSRYSLYRDCSGGAVLKGKALDSLEMALISLIEACPQSSTASSIICHHRD